MQLSAVLLHMQVRSLISILHHNAPNEIKLHLIGGGEKKDSHSNRNSYLLRVKIDSQISKIDFLNISY